MRYRKVYQLLVERGAWDDPPDTDEIIAAALDAARDAVAAVDHKCVALTYAIHAIDELRGES